MSIQTELARLTNAKNAIQTAIEGKGVTVPSGTLLDGMAALIDAIEAGGGGNIVAGSFTPTSDIKTYTVNHNFNTKDICFVVFMSANKNYVSRGIVHSSYTAGGKSWQVFNGSDSFYSTVFGMTSDPTITKVSVDLTGFFYNSVFISGSTYIYFVWKNGEI